MGKISIFKKTCQSKKFTIYLGKRELIGREKEPAYIDGLIFINSQELLADDVIIVALSASFRYGREDLDVLGVSFRKELLFNSQQIYPPAPPVRYAQQPNQQQQQPMAVTALQEYLRRRLGADCAIPFRLMLPAASPASVVLQPDPAYSGKPCGVEYELKALAKREMQTKPTRFNVVRVAVRKLYSADQIDPNILSAPRQRTVEGLKDFSFGAGRCSCELTLDREVYFHGDEIVVRVHILNNSNKTVKRIGLSCMQHAEVCIFADDSYDTNVADLETTEGFPLGPGFELNKTYTLRPLAENNRGKGGVALDGSVGGGQRGSGNGGGGEKAKRGANEQNEQKRRQNLASSSPKQAMKQKDKLGIMISYYIRARLTFGGLHADLLVDVPIMLMNAPTPPSASALLDSALLLESMDLKDDDDEPAHNGPTGGGDKPPLRKGVRVSPLLSIGSEATDDVLADDEQQRDVEEDDDKDGQASNGGFVDARTQDVF